MSRSRPRKTLRYDRYGAAIGLGLPLVGTAIEALRLFHSVAPAALARAHLEQPLLWIMDATPLVLGLLGRIIVDQQETVLRQSEALVEVEQARREGFEATARRLSLAAQGLLATVTDFTTTPGAAAELVRRVNETMNALSQSASAAAITADTVIGIGVQAERASADGLQQVEASGAELLRLAEEVRDFAGTIEVLTSQLAELRERPAAVELAGRAQRLSERAVKSARVAARTSETMRELAVSLRESARAAREIARVAQQQEGDIEQVLKAMSEIAHATVGTVVSTRHVEREAASLNELAASLQDAVKRG